MSKHLISHAKQQEEALTNPEARHLLDELAAQWPSLNHIQRGERLKVLRDLHCTNRGIAYAVGRTEGTIRRDLDIEELPPRQRTATEHGANPASFLREQRNWEERVNDLCRLLRESLDGSVSDALAWNAVWFLSRYDSEDCLNSYMVDKLFEEIGFRFRCQHGEIRSSWVPAKWKYEYPNTTNRRNVGLVRLAHECRPQPQTDETVHPVGHVVEGVIRFVEQLENRYSIIDRGLDKARNICRCLDRDHHLNFVRQAADLGPEGYARMLHSRISSRNSIPDVPVQLVA